MSDRIEGHIEEIQQTERDATALLDVAVDTCCNALVILATAREKRSRVDLETAKRRAVEHVTGVRA